ncbi:MAG: hypothetical protein RR382_00930 [Tannerellaceae bacterium]
MSAFSDHTPFNAPPSPSQQVDTSSEIQGTAESQKLTSNAMYVGTITRVNMATGLMDVRILQTIVNDCVWAAGVMMNIIGVNTHYTPPAGTSVIVMYTSGTSYVISVIPSSRLAAKFPGINCTGTPPADWLANLSAFSTPFWNADKGVGANPADAVAGEFVLENALGPFIGVLTNIATLSAGSRASIEACLLNDMVRITSRYFMHHRADADVMAYDNGRLNYEENATSYPHEAFGNVSKDDPYGEMEKGAVSLAELRDDDTGRWRFSKWQGFMGDFIHTCITDPMETIGRIAAESIRSGKSSIHQGSDGTILVQSVAEIALERVVRVLVPIRTERWDDANAICAEQLDTMNARFIKMWEPGVDMKKFGQTVWQLREYSRYLSGLHSLGRFMQNRFIIPSEKNTPKPKWTNDEKDRKEANPDYGDAYIDAYSCIRIMRDGSIIVMDTENSAIVMNKGNVSISAKNDIIMHAGRDISLNAKNIYTTAAKNHQACSVEGVMELKSRAAMKLYCELGGVWLKSDFDKEKSKQMSKDNRLFQSEEPTEPQAPGNEYGVFIESPNAKTAMSSKKGTYVNVTGEEKDNSVVVTAFGGDVVNMAKNNVLIQASSSVNIASVKPIYIGAPEAVNINSQLIALGGNCVVRGSQLDVTSLNAKFGSFKGGIRGPKNPQGNPRHENHIQSMGDDEKGPDLPHEIKAPKRTEVGDILTTNGRWEFTRNTWHSADVENDNGTVLHENPYEQACKLKDQGTETHEGVPLSKMRLLYGVSCPFPGANAMMACHTPKDKTPLNQTSEEEPQNYATSAAQYVTQPYTLWYKTK